MGFEENHVWPARRKLCRSKGNINTKLWCSSAIFCLACTLFVQLLKISNHPKTIPRTFIVYHIDTSLSSQKRKTENVRLYELEQLSSNSPYLFHKESLFQYSTPFLHLCPVASSGMCLRRSLQTAAETCPFVCNVLKGRLPFPSSFAVTAAPLPTPETVGKHWAGTGTTPELNTI